MRTTRPLAVAAAAVATAFALAACGGTTDASDDATGDAESPDAPAASAEFPITIEHAFGETVIEAQPERVATVGWSNQEAALALGVVPVVMEAATWGDDDDDGVLPWVEDKLTEMGAETPALYDGTEGIDFEAIDDADPDIILSAYSGLTQEDYDTLTAIAPVVAYPGVAWGTTWQDTILVNGTALGFETEATDLVAELEGEISAAVDGAANLSGQGAAFAFFDPADLSAISFYTEVDPRAGFLSESAGLAVPAKVAEAGEEEFFASVPADLVDDLADIEVIVTYGTPDQLEALQADPQLSRIPAVANGAIVWLDEATAAPTAASANPSPLAISYLIENYLPLLDEAAGKTA